MSDVKRKVTESVNKSGYPLELLIYSYLEERFIASANQYFFDYDENKSRSIDMVAEGTQFYKAQDGKVALDIDLAIECKRSVTHAWVFYKLNTFVDGSNLGQVIDFYQVAKADLNTDSLLWSPFGPILHYADEFNSNQIAHSYSNVRIGNEIDPKPSKESKDEIFEAINQVVKYVAYAIKQEYDILREHYLLRKVEVDFKFFHPIIVFDGHMFEGMLTTNGIELTERDHIIVQYKYQPKYLSSPKTFLIDVVRKDYFQALIDQILKSDSESLSEVMKTKYVEFLKLAEELDENMEEKRDRL